MKFFLKIKHWQLFMIMIGVPIIVIAFANPIYLIVRLVCSTVVFGFYFGWLYSLGVSLNKKLPKGIDMSLTYFKVSFFVFIVFFLGSVLLDVFYDRPRHEGWFVMLPILIFLQICLLYIFYIVSKSLNMVELKREVLYKDYADEFFLLLFYPFGIWRIQPRINKLFEDN